MWAATRGVDRVVSNGRVQRFQEISRKIPPSADVLAVVFVVQDEALAGHALIRADVRVVQVGV